MSDVDFKRLISLSKELHCVLDTDGKCLHLGVELANLVFGSSRTSREVYFSALVHPDDIGTTQDQLRGLADETVRIEFSNRIRIRSGQYLPVHWSAARADNEPLIYLVADRMDGVRPAADGVQSALRREHETRDELDRVQNRLAELLRVEGIGGWELDIRTNTLWWSDGIYRIFELEDSSEPATYDEFLSAIHPDDRDRVDRTLRQSASDNQPYEVDHRLMMSDGRIKYVHEQGRSIYGTDGRPVRTVGTVRELTERTRSEISLIESNTRFAAALEGVAAGFFILDRQWRYHFINSMGAQLVNKKPDELHGRIIWEEFPQAVGSGFYEVYHRVMESREPEILEEYFDMLDTWFEVHVYPYVDGISVFFLDTTQRKRDERELLEKEAALAASPGGIIMIDLSGNIVYANPAFLRLWDYPDEGHVLGRPATSLWQDEGAARQAMATLRESGSWAGELSVSGRDGRPLTIQIAANAIHETNNEVVGFVISFVDITEHREFEAALSLTSLAIETSLNGIVITDADERAVYANSSYIALFGYSAGDMGREKPLENFTDAVAVAELRARLREHGTWQGELVGCRKDGKTFETIVSASVIREADESVSHIVLSILDISDNKRLEEQFLQAQKMESVGRLAGGVAHDFNNLLTVIMGNVELAQSRVAPDNPGQSFLAQIDKAAQSAAAVTQQLLAFSRRQIITPRVVNLNTIVDHTRHMLKRLIGEDIELKTILGEKMSNVIFDPGQVEQILINLAVNARDSMPNGGKITIETGDVRLTEDYAAEHLGAEPGKYVMIAFSDNGHGMTKEVKEHLFEPFYTTKGRDKGTGLGLAMVHGAVSQNGGRIEVYSEVGAGTTFRIYLPSVAREESAADSVTTHELMPRGAERILVVEDDEDIRVLAEHLLEALGYTIAICKDGADAVRRVQTEADPFDLLITDVILPDMDGKTVAQRVGEITPTIRVLFTSGYTENVIVHHGVLKPGVKFLPKPYSPPAIAQRVREVLDERRP